MKRQISQSVSGRANSSVRVAGRSIRASIALAGIIVAVVPQSTRANTVIDYPNTDGKIFGFLPNPNVTPYNYGQTFSVGTDTLLTQFEFYGNASDYPATFYIAPWTGGTTNDTFVAASAMGTPIYSVAVPASPLTEDLLNPLIFNFSTPLQLNPDTQYAAYLYGQDYEDFYLSDTSYTGGVSVQQMDGGDWSLGLEGTLAFKATLATPVPEPASAVLVTVGAIVCMNRRRRTATSEKCVVG